MEDARKEGTGKYPSPFVQHVLYHLLDILPPPAQSSYTEYIPAWPSILPFAGTEQSGIMPEKTYRFSGNKKIRSFSNPALCFWGFSFLSLAIFCNFHFTDG